MIPKRPAWMSEKEWYDEQRRAYQQLEYEAYNSPPWIDKSARILAWIIVVVLVLGVLFAFIKAAIGGYE